MTPARIALADGRLTWSARPPVVPRRTGRGRVHLVQVGGGPLGGDRLGLDVEVGAGERLEVHTAAATVVQPGATRADATWTVTARVGPGAVLEWWPEPTVVTDGADWTAVLRVDLAADASLVLAERVVLGRSGQHGGRCRSDLDVRVDGAPRLVTSTRLDGADPALGGPGGSGGARSVGTLVAIGPHAPRPGTGRPASSGAVRWAWTDLEGGGAQMTALGEVRAVGEVLAGARARSLAAG